MKYKKQNISLKVGVLVLLKERLLLIKEKNRHDGKYYWNIIKGTFDPRQDDSLVKTAEREAREEAGVNIKVKDIFNIFEVRWGDGITLQFNFLSECKSAKIILSSKEFQKEQSEDIIEARFFNKVEIKKMKRRDFYSERAFIVISQWIKNKDSDRSVFYSLNKS